MDVEQEFTHPDIPGLRVYASAALAPGQAILFDGNKLFLSPKAVHELRKQAYAMSNNKVEAASHQPEPSKRELKRAARKVRTRAMPPAAKVGAAFVILSVTAAIVAGCVAANNAGVAYDQCIQKIAQEHGHEAAKLAMNEGECQ